MNARQSRALQRRFATKIRRTRNIVIPRGGRQMPVDEYIALFNRLNHLKD